MNILNSVKSMMEENKSMETIVFGYSTEEDLNTIKENFQVVETGSDSEGSYAVIKNEQYNISSAAAALGRKGGSAKTEVKKVSSAENGKKGGRPLIPKYILELAKKYMLDVTVTTQIGEYNKKYKVYHFSGNFLANFEALEREVKGYCKSTEFPASLVKC